MSESVIPSTRWTSAIPRCVMRLVGADPETVEQSPAVDRGNILAIAALMFLVFLYQAGVLSLIGHQILAQDGEFRPDIVFAAILIALLIQQIDSYAFVRAGFYDEGLAELKRGGLDLTGGPARKIQAGVRLGIRILLSLGFAQLTAIFMSLFLLKADLNAAFDHRIQAANTKIIAVAAAHADADIHRAAETEKAAEANLRTLQQQVVTTRDGAVSPADADRTVRATEDELTRLTAQRAQVDAELNAARTYASNELSGIKADPSNSGQKGRGPKRLAAEERVRDLTANEAAIDHALLAAQNRLDSLRKQTSPSDARDRARAAKSALPQVQEDVAAAKDEVAAAQRELARLTAARDQTIRTEVVNSADCVDCGRGIVASLKALEDLAEDSEIAAVIALIDLTSFGLELAAVLARVTAFVPTTYAALLARNTYMRVVEIVDDMDAELNRRRPDEPPEDVLPPIGPAPLPGGEGDATTPSEDLPSFDLTPSNGFDPGGHQAKRPRGRPRKSDLN